MKKFFEKPYKKGTTNNHFIRLVLLLVMGWGSFSTYAQINCAGFSGTYAKSDTGCFGSAVGSILATPVNGLAPYMYKLNSGVYGSANPFNNLKAGNYKVSIMDANGCTTVSPIINISQHPAVTGSLVATNTICHDSASSITVTPLTGTAPFRYRLGSGSYGTSNTFSVHGTGTFAITIMDANGCTGIVSAKFINPIAITATTIITNATPCATSTNGSVTINPTSGVSPYLYKLNATGTYGSSNTFSGLKAGTYKVYMKDANSCAVIKTVVIGAPAAVVVGYTKANPICPNQTGSITLNAPGSPNATFRLSPGSNAYTSQASFGSLAAGTYYGYAKNANGCIGKVGPVVISVPALCNGLVLWYPFSGNAKDSSGNANDGVASSNVTPVADRFNRPNMAFRFYGANNGGPSTIVSTKKIRIAGATPRTVSFWFDWYSVNSPEAPGILGWGTQNTNGAFCSFHIKQDSSMVMRGHYLDFYSAAGLIHTNTWNHVVYTYDGSNATFYINGIKNTTATYTSATDSTRLQIGHSTDTYTAPFDWPAYFDGAIDDIRIYNRALDSSEVGLLYNDTAFTPPVQVLNLTCTKNDKSIQLTWQASNEFNSSQIFVQRSSDGQIFTNLGKIESSKIVSKNTYQTLDNKPLVGMNYYRLQIVDKNVKTTYSKIVKVLVGQELEVILTPNPSNNVFRLTTNTTKAEDIQLRVININGKVVYTAKGFPTQVFTFGEAFAKGIYLAEVRQGNEVKTTKVVKN